MPGPTLAHDSVGVRSLLDKCRASERFSVPVRRWWAGVSDADYLQMIGPRAAKQA